MDATVLASGPFAQWVRLGLAEVATDHGERYPRWTAAGLRYGTAAERFAAMQAAGGQPPLDARPTYFDPEGYALVDED